MPTLTANRLAKRVIFPGPEDVSLQEVTLPPLAEDQVLIQNRYSLLSSGTEGICFYRNFEAGSHWDRWVQYPFYPGYASVGEIASVGANSGGLKVGERVVHRNNHASFTIAKADDVIRVPEEIELLDAVWFALAKITFHGLLAAEYQVGEDALVIGAGPIGQMTLRWARLAGARRIAVVDPIASRLEVAQRGGAHQVFAVSIEEAKPLLQDQFGREGFPVVMETTGNAKVFSHALSLTRSHGRVVLMGDTGFPTRQGLTSEVITRGIQIVGAHDGHNTEKWNGRTIPGLFFDYLRDGRMQVDQMITHRLNPGHPAKAYRLLRDLQANAMGIVFDWATL